MIDCLHIVGLKESQRNRPRLGETFIVVPDVQARADVPDEHNSWIGNYIMDRKPDRILCLGDYADMTSLCVPNRGRIEAEGRRYIDDIAAARRAMAKLMSPIQGHNKRYRTKYYPAMDFCKGNHEDRCDRIGKEQPHLFGALSSKDLGFEQYGWKMHEYMKVIRRGGIEFSHLFTSGAMGRPVSSAAALLRLRQGSAVQGHVQATDWAIHSKTQKIALFAGCATLHDEDYLGLQGNDYRRQIWVFFEVHGDGHFSPLPVTMAWLKAKYS